MDQATSVTELRQYLQHWRDHARSTAFIPTMGNLHAGHMSLIEKGQSLCDRSICSIFVNPMQFGPNEDWDHYPRTLESDIKQLEAIGCDLVYLPTASELYPEGLDKISQVLVTDLTDHYEGAHRPGHFTGVATVVLKLFNIVKPDVSNIRQEGLPAVPCHQQDGRGPQPRRTNYRPGNHARSFGPGDQFA